MKQSARHCLVELYEILLKQLERIAGVIIGRENIVFDIQINVVFSRKKCIILSSHSQFHCICKLFYQY